MLKAAHATAQRSIPDPKSALYVAVHQTRIWAQDLEALYVHYRPLEEILRLLGINTSEPLQRDLGINHDKNDLSAHYSIPKVPYLGVDLDVFSQPAKLLLAIEKPAAPYEGLSKGCRIIIHPNGYCVIKFSDPDNGVSQYSRTSSEEGIVYFCEGLKEMFPGFGGQIMNACKRALAEHPRFATPSAPSAQAKSVLRKPGAKPTTPPNQGGKPAEPAA
jgi:hypothetical protein